MDDGIRSHVGQRVSHEAVVAEVALEEPEIAAEAAPEGIEPFRHGRDRHDGPRAHLLDPGATQEAVGTRDVGPAPGQVSGE